MKISVIITSYKEPKTIGKAIESIAKQKYSNLEILVLAPDKDTLLVAKKLKSKYNNLKVIQDLGNGKPAALNLAVKKAKGEILILTDGDVFVNDISISKLLIPFKNKKVGGVSGNPISLNSKNNMLGYWAYVLTNIANNIRNEKLNENNKFFCTGYLFAIRRNLFPKLPEELLSEDGYISYNIYNKGYIIKYAPKAKVYVKYPTTIKDWITQKRRSAGGYNQIRKITSFYGRSFISEALGMFRLIKYIHNIREFIWIVYLCVIRLYLWMIIYIDINIKKKKQSEIWKRVESTK